MAAAKTKAKSKRKPKRLFAPFLLHSSQYKDGEDWGGRNAIVIGTGNSGHDIAQDLYSAGAKVTLVQRSPTLITNIEPSAQLAYSLYDEGPPTEDCDLIATSMPLQVARKSHQMLTEQGRRLGMGADPGQRGGHCDSGGGELGERDQLRSGRLAPGPSGLGLRGRKQDQHSLRLGEPGPGRCLAAHSPSTRASRAGKSESTKLK